MQNGFDISQYIEELAIVAAVTGVIYILGDKLQGGFGKFLSISCALVVAFYMISPIVDFLNGNDVELDQSISVPTYQPQQSDEYYSILTDYTIDNLCIIAKRDIERSYSVLEDEYTIELEGEICDEKFTINGCTITLKTINALSKRQYIEDYIKETFGCSCEFYENIL